MIVDIVSHQQLPEVFSTNRNHHCSHKRNSTTINTISSSNTMTNGHRVRVREKKKNISKNRIIQFLFFFKRRMNLVKKQIKFSDVHQLL